MSASTTLCKYTTEALVAQRAEELIQRKQNLKTLSEELGVTLTAKSGFGDIIEAWYGIKKNSRSGPDLVEAGIELKATPVVKIKKGYRASERLVCNIINYNNEATTHSFEESSFVQKCAKMQIFFYEYIKNENRLTYQLHWTFLMKLKALPQKDWATIVADWHKIHSKIMQGLAHEISGADTNYLEACTKGSSASSMREQPFSEILAKQRAYALKVSYMTVYFNRYVLKKAEHLEELQKDNETLDLESYVQMMIAPYRGKTEKELCKEFDINFESKSHNASLIRAIFKLQTSNLKNLNTKIEEFKKANITFKTIRLKHGGIPKEAMSFPAFKAVRLVSETSWEASDLYQMLTETRYCFVIFKCNEQGEYIFDNCFFWNLPMKDLDAAREVWSHTREILKSKEVYLPQTNLQSRRESRFMKSTENRVMHVRPHGQNSSDVDVSLQGLSYTKHCFWFNQKYIKEVIETHE